MPLPEGYLPRKGDIVLVQARAKRDAYKDEPDIQCYFEIVGYETNKFFMTVSEIHSIYSRNWEVGETVKSLEFDGPGTICGVSDPYVWVKCETGEDAGGMYTIDANELEAYVEPPPLPGQIEHMDGSGPVLIQPTLPNWHPDWKDPATVAASDLGTDGPMGIEAAVPEKYAMPIAAPPAVDAASIGDDDMPI
jgi:hypothetical protein